MTVQKMFDSKSVWTAGSRDNLVWHVEDQAFPQRDYDMKITFTAKPQTFNPGDQVNVKDSWYYQGGKVLAQHKNQVVVVDTDDDIEVYEADELELS